MSLCLACSIISAGARGQPHLTSNSPTCPLPSAHIRPARMREQSDLSFIANAVEVMWISPWNCIIPTGTTHAPPCLLTCTTHMDLLNCQESSMNRVPFSCGAATVLHCAVSYLPHLYTTRIHISSSYCIIVVFVASQTLHNVKFLEKKTLLDIYYYNTVYYFYYLKLRKVIAIFMTKVRAYLVRNRDA